MRERARPGWRAVGAAIAVLCVTLLAACSAGTPAGASTTPSVPQGSATTGAGQRSPGAQGTPILVITPVDGGAIAGPSGDVCHQQPHVAAALPASIPMYPNGELRLADQSQGVALFGLCSADSPTAVAQFYAAQLQVKGWDQIQTNAIDSTQIVTAAQGSAHVVVTIQPDPLAAGKAQIVIQATGM